MPAKPKRRQEDKSPDLRYKAAHVVKSHPWLTLSTLASVAGILPVIGAILAWAFGFLETSASANAREAKLHAEIVNVQAALEAHKLNMGRIVAWATVQTVSLQVTSLRNRVNDCDIKKDKRESMTPLERAACAQYQQEFEDATRRFNEARSTALATTKEK